MTYAEYLIEKYYSDLNYFNLFYLSDRLFAEISAIIKANLSVYHQLIKFISYL